MKTCDDQDLHTDEGSRIRWPGHECTDNERAIYGSHGSCYNAHFTAQSCSTNTECEWIWAPPLASVCNNTTHSFTTTAPDPNSYKCGEFKRLSCGAP